MPQYTATYATAPTTADKVLEMVFKGEIDMYIKCKTILDDNIQKAYSLVLGQCTELLQSKLKQHVNWQQVSINQDVITLLAMIKMISYKFEDQKFLPLALYQAKSNIFNLCQGNMSYHDYLQHFHNLVDVAQAYDGHLYDQAIIDLIVK